MEELLLIPCCGSKVSGGIIGKQGRKVEDTLDESSRKRLRVLRKEVAGSFGFNFDDEKLPAFKRYSGNLYGKISDGTWKILSQDSDLELAIISALYGVILWDEYIINYNVAMGDNIYAGRKLNTWWRQHGLADIVASFIARKKVRRVRSFLSGDYRQAVSGPMNTWDGVWLQYEYPGLGSGSNYYRGEDVTRVIRDRGIACPACASRETRRIARNSFECLECGGTYEPE